MSDRIEAQLTAVLELSRWALSRGADARAIALEALVDAERWRRGAPDGSGALHRFALTQGNLVASEYDLSIFAHRPWPVGVVTADPRELIRLNDALGFPAVDALLRTFVQRLKEIAPKATVLRFKSASFALLFFPSAEITVSAALRDQIRDEGTRALRDAVTEAGSSLPVEITSAALDLEILRPPAAFVLGPLIVAECERAHAAERLGKASGLQRRRIDLDGLL